MRAYRIIVSNKQKKVKTPTGLQLLVRRCCNATLREEGVQPPAELGVTFLDDHQIRDLNREYRHINLPTDVLAFPLGENGVYEKNLETGCVMLGDVVISLEMAKMQSEVYNHLFEREIGFLAVHGVLHILGYDHERSKEEAEIMREKEKEIITKVGLCVHEISPVSKFLRV